MPFFTSSASALSRTWDIVAFSAEGLRLLMRFSSGFVNSPGMSKPMSPVRSPMSRGERVSTNRPFAWHCLYLLIQVSRERTDLEMVHCGNRWRWSLRLSRPLWSNESVAGRCSRYLETANAIGVLRNGVSLFVNEYHGSLCSDDRIPHVIFHIIGCMVDVGKFLYRF